MSAFAFLCIPIDHIFFQEFLEEAPEDIKIDPEAETEEVEEHKFSLQVAWVNIKPSSAGHIVRVKCKNRQQTWLESDKGKNSNVNLYSLFFSSIFFTVSKKHDMDKVIFEGSMKLKIINPKTELMGFSLPQA